MLLLSEQAVMSLIDMEAAITASTSAFAWTSSGAAITPVRQAISLNKGPSVALFMPGFLPGDGCVSCSEGGTEKG